MTKDKVHEEELATQQEGEGLPEMDAVTSGSEEAAEGLEEQVASDMLVLINDMENRYKRLQADFDNFRKRTQGEKEQLSSFVKGELIQQLLPVLDNFERALAGECEGSAASYKEGFTMIYKSLEDQLTRMGLTPIDALGKEFDPAYHQAVMHGSSDEYEDQQVGQVLQKGYMVDGKVIRPAMVMVVTK